MLSKLVSLRADGVCTCRRSLKLGDVFEDVIFDMLRVVIAGRGQDVSMADPLTQ